MDIINSIFAVFGYNYIQNKIKEGWHLPQISKDLGSTCENIKLAGKRRKLTAIQLAERSAIERLTLRKIEQGDPSGFQCFCTRIIIRGARPKANIVDLEEKGWKLSPAFDINPSIDKNGLALNLDMDNILYIFVLAFQLSSLRLIYT